MAQAPLYNQGDTVYLRDSAALGFLEAYIVHTITHRPDGLIVYSLSTHLKPPAANMTMGDRNTGRVLHPLTFFEHELVSYCDALALAVANTQKQLAKLQAQQAISGCLPDAGTEGTG